MSLIKFRKLSLTEWNALSVKDTNTRYTVYTDDGVSIFGEYVGDKPVQGYININYADLVALRDASLLTPGQQYRITDYVTTTVQENTRSAGHQFDIIVVADDVDKLNENARAVRSDRGVPVLKGITASIATNLGEAGDVLKRAPFADNNHPEGFMYAWGTNADIDDEDTTNFVYTKSTNPAEGDDVWHDGDYGVVVSRIEEDYFANSKLEAWQLKYCLDNDADRFAWADDVNGKGVIYRMIDEFNNDCPYDFKNIQFKRKITDGQYDPVSGDETWAYTFSCYDTNSTDILDATMVSGYLLNNGNEETTFTSENKIEVYTLSGDGDYDTEVLGLAWLNEIVFIERFDVSQLGQEGIYREPTHHNSFGSNCLNMTFGTACAENSFGSRSTNGVFRDYCSNNTFGSGFKGGTFGNGCSSNTFSNDCSGNTFGNYCVSNTFSNTCRDNTFGDSCRDNTFGNNCQHNTFGNNCQHNTFGSDCKYLKISDNTGTQKRYISVDNGTVGASSVNKFDLYDSAILNKNYQVTFKKSAGGKYLMLWATDTGTMTGKVKDSVLDNTWEDIL